jgi:PEP-CTERM motif
MKSSVVAALGAAVFAFGASSAAQAAMINFGIAVFGATPTYTGTSLNASTAFDFGDATLLVSEVGPGDDSGLIHKVSTVHISPSDIVYGAGTGSTTLPGSGVTKTWTGSTGDMFTETLTTVDSINRLTPNAITVTLSGTVSDTDGIFTDAPIFLILSASQAGGPPSTVLALMTDTTTIGAIPEASTWAMMALGFGAFGYAAARRRKTNIAALSA